MDHLRRRIQHRGGTPRQGGREPTPTPIPSADAPAGTARGPSRPRRVHRGPARRHHRRHLLAHDTRQSAAEQAVGPAWAASCATGTVSRRGRGIWLGEKLSTLSKQNFGNPERELAEQKHLAAVLSPGAALLARPMRAATNEGPREQPVDCGALSEPGSTGVNFRYPP